MNLFGKYPGIVRQYDRDRREIRVEVPGFTDGGQELPIAEIEYPIGDKSKHTEIRVLVDDMVWVEFLGGDPRFPIITGWRCPNVGNVTLFRRWHMENIESDADQTQKHTAGTTYTVDAQTDILIKAGQTITLDAGSKITLKVGGSTFEITGSGIKQVSSANTMQGPLTQTGGDILSDGKSVQHHTHIGNLGSPTSPPQ